mgnify:CR=1 FL=1
MTAREGKRQLRRVREAYCMSSRLALDARKARKVWRKMRVRARKREPFAKRSATEYSEAIIYKPTQAHLVMDCKSGHRDAHNLK